MQAPRKKPPAERDVRGQEGFAGTGLRLLRPEDDQAALVADDPAQHPCPAEGVLAAPSSQPSQATTRTLQDLYRDLAEAVCPELQRRADGGEEQARGLLARLSGVGERLGVRSPDRDSAAADVPAGNVMMVTQQGYKLHDRVVRPAQVIVSSGPTTHA